MNVRSLKELCCNSLRNKDLEEILEGRINKIEILLIYRMALVVSV